jgi:hypothetical protein
VSEGCGGLMFFFLGSQCVPKDVPIKHLTFIPYVLTKVGDLPNHNISCYTFGLFGKLSMSKGAPTLV